MRVNRSWILAVAVVFLAGSANLFAAGNAKVRICHIPPGDSDNFHTIMVSENALLAHLAHGDVIGSCDEYCDILCDDGDACTIDACDPATGTCLADHPPVDCEDGDSCTINNCDPLSGCLSAPVVCDDFDECTANLCSEGNCLYPLIDCGPNELCDPASGCYDPCGGVICDPIDQCHEPGNCVYPGECVDGPPEIDGIPCDDGNPATEDDECNSGVCVGIPTECDGSDPTLVRTCEEVGAEGHICVGEQNCRVDGWGPCEGLRIEICNAVDDDCDGEIDELIDGGDCDTGLLGECGNGYLLCDYGVFVCTQGHFPSMELCSPSGYDEDCDGEVDEGCP